MVLPALVSGSKQDMSYHKGKVVLHTLYGTAGATAVVENKCGVDIDFTLDCSGSSNMISNQGSLKAKVNVRDGGFELVHQLVPKVEGDPWSVNFSMTFEPSS